MPAGARTGPPILAPAKINLTLGVLGGSGADGYHELRGVFARLVLADELALSSIGEPSDDAGESLRAVPGSIAVDHPSDLILRAAALVRAWAERPLPTLTIDVLKRIPIAAGLAGGSSDGVAALRLLAEAWRLEIPAPALAAMALGLGADAPFFLGASPVALIGGRGERVEPLPAGIAGAGIVLVVVGGKPSTGAVFDEHDRFVGDSTGSASAATDLLVDALRGGLTPRGLADLAPQLREGNDLFPAALRLIPHLGETRRWVETALGRAALLSGAGSTLFVVYPSAEDATGAGRRLEGALAARPSRRPLIIATAIAGQ